MYLLLSGEGKSDIGECYPAFDHCDATDFQPGAMSIFIDQLIEMTSLLDFKTHLEAAVRVAQSKK